MKPVVVKNVAIGEGIPKICVPIVETSEDEITAAAEKIASGTADLIEWRADYYENHKDEEKLTALLGRVHAACGDKPLLFTLRSAGEGGRADLSNEEYLDLNQAVIRNGGIDMIDVEHDRGEAVCRQLLKNAHLHSMPVIISKHHMTSTPEDDLMTAEIRTMTELGGDICKLAVLPQDKEDVVRLLMLTEQLSRDFQDIPIVTVSMSGLGVISRISGEISGSAITYASAGKASAPGQIEIGELQDLLQKVHQGMKEAETQQ